MQEQEELDVVEIVGSVFITDALSGDEEVIGIDTDDEEFFLTESDHDDDLRNLEGELVRATGSVWSDESGNNWLDLASFELAD